MRTLQQLASDEEQRYPIGASVIRSDVYMDDVLTGAASFDEELQRQLKQDSARRAASLYGNGRRTSLLYVRKCLSNIKCNASLGPGDHTKPTPHSDFNARLFDPLGWLTPAVVNCKIAFQATWLQGIDWDDPLDEASAKRWQDYQNELPLLEQIRIPRWIGPRSLDGEAELHGFADASERAYAAVIYLRTEINNEWHTFLIAAETKVAPIRQITLPRLELSAAALFARLAAHVRTTLYLSKTPMHLWSDFTVALGWIRGHPSRRKNYVANRVAKIQTTVPGALWHHIPGRDNPADFASRGLSPGELVNHHLWWQGLPWFQLGESSWPVSSGLVTYENLLEERTRVHVAEAQPSSGEEPAELLRFSSYHRLLRVTAWCRRWLPQRGNAGPAADEAEQLSGNVLSTAALEDARLLWLRLVQSTKYKDELKAIRKGRGPGKSSPLIRLSPFLDRQGILRVGGRLKHAILDYDERHPIILPSESTFSRLIVEACHRRCTAEYR
ncbi:uncharacterized protein LOC115239656 [Formica exsecta]|uniref:uncharacterized protein LOC115239656 n=1 Tax=Formica exsecta TaxID=72781 RepID=UPI0011450C82|nr:uncharacterized protein LOC115239656 [Formica exsecta]